MTTNNIITLISVLASLGVLSWLIALVRPVIDKLFEKLEAETKNKNLELFEKWAQQAVHEAETALAGYQGSVKKAAAISMIAKRIEENNLVGHFSYEAISGAIEQAIGLLPQTNADPVAEVPKFSSPAMPSEEVANASQS